MSRLARRLGMMPWDVEAATDPRVVRWLVLDEMVAEFESVVDEAGG